jgi:hypothetical protein
MPINEEARALSTEEMLAEEANEIHGQGAVTLSASLQSESGHQAHQNRMRLNADDRTGAEIDRKIVDARNELYRSLNGLKRAALCFSGGGIRSATFCLGILQALAACDATQFEANHGEPQAGGPDITPSNSLLGRFHYLSTVSGGGYVGSWLSSWRHRDSFAAILRNLTGRPSGTDIEPPEISWLRAYSNYLTPRIGIGSADTWAALAIIVRNLVLNWLVIIPVLCAVLLALKIIVTGAVWVAHQDTDDWLVQRVLLAGVIFLIGAQAFTTYHRPPRRPLPSKDHPAVQSGNTSQTGFVWCNLVWSVLSAIAVTIFFSSHYFRDYDTSKWPDSGFVKTIGTSANVGLVLAMALVGCAIYALGWLVGSTFAWIRRRAAKIVCRDLVNGAIDFFAWASSGLVYGALVGLGALLFLWLGSSASEAKRLLLAVIFGVPWVLMAQLTADNIFGGLVSYEPLSDSDREWLGRAAGWVSAIATAWIVLIFLIFAGEQLVHIADRLIGRAAATAVGSATGIISGLLTALLGKSDKTPAQSSSADQESLGAKASNLALALAGPIFAAVLIVTLSLVLDELLLRGFLVDELRSVNSLPLADRTAAYQTILMWLSIGLGIALAIALLASWRVNINRFSLHALYRNRLVRAYLGASRQERHPDRFTGFDPEDNVRMHELWPAVSKERCLFHVVNIALNVVAAKRLAWQERKAESFTVSPRHCGSAYVGFRRSKHYDDGPKDEKAQYDPSRKFGIALGTAMGISGAAVSSNMGYHSSPSLGLLLTLFNVRLGWWLGNPGPAGDKADAYRREGPRFSALPLLFEACGQTTDQRPYVYLSDGGHFENLGLYEMVRRRCRLIVLVDAGCDAGFAFEDLGNAVRKIYIDLGIRITFEKLEELKNRPSEQTLRRASQTGIPYHAIGTIRYSDPSADGPGCKDGKVIYIKPAYHGSEGAAIQAYAKANKTFPHETTADQWFTESQFESYRALGLDIANNVLDQRDVRATLERFFTE